MRSAEKLTDTILMMDETEPYGIFYSEGSANYE